MSKRVLSLKNVTISHGEKIILSNINLEVNHGEFIYIIGKTGSGKSSFMKARLKKQFYCLFCLCSVFMLPQWSFSQTHITMSLQNCEFTSDTTLEFDVYLFNDGTTSIQLGALSFGINYDRAILNGGTPGKNAFTYLPGSKDNVFANLIRYVPQHALTNHHLRFTTSPVSKLVIFSTM